jgi:hypothetical protein
MTQTAYLEGEKALDSAIMVSFVDAEALSYAIARSWNLEKLGRGAMYYQG